MIVLTFQHFDQFTYSVSTLRGRLHGSGGENRRLAPHAARRFERTQAQLAGRDMAKLQLVGMEQPFPRSGGVAASRSSRRAACRASLPAFTLIAVMPALP